MVLYLHEMSYVPMHKLQKVFMDNLTNTTLIASSIRGNNVNKFMAFCHHMLISANVILKMLTSNSKALGRLQPV